MLQVAFGLAFIFCLMLDVWLFTLATPCGLQLPLQASQRPALEIGRVRGPSFLIGPLSQSSRAELLGLILMVVVSRTIYRKEMNGCNIN